MLRFLLLLLSLSLGAQGIGRSKWSKLPILFPITEATTDAVPTTPEEPWSSTPYCFGLTECECEDDDIEDRAIEEEECCPCVCANPGWCRQCVCPKTAACQCVCNNENASMTNPVTHEPPPMTFVSVILAVSDLKENVTVCLDELDTYHTQFWACFGEDNVKPYLNPVRNAVRNALVECETTLGFVEVIPPEGDVDNLDLIRSLDRLAGHLRRAKEKLHEFTVEMAKLIASNEGISTDDKDFDNPVDMAIILDAWNPVPGPCAVSKDFLVSWHPHFWAWSVWGETTWSLYHKLCWYWLCILYIRITIIVKVWWAWLWKPWEWFFPFFWCFWWPPIPFLGGVDA